MKLQTLVRTFSLAVAGILALARPVSTLAEDIDVFIAGEGGSSAANVLIVLDNTSNWAAANQKWPAPDKQGQAELKAIKDAILSLDDSVRVGLMMFTNNGSGNCCNGGYIRFALQPMTDANKTAFAAVLDDIVANFNDPDNQAASSATPAMTLFDAFKYFGGYTSPPHANDNVAGTPMNSTHFSVPVFASPPSAYPASKADPKGYADVGLTQYLPPDAAEDACGGRNFIVYIGNGWEPNDQLPQQNMKTFLQGVDGNSTQLRLPVLNTTTTTTWSSTNTGTSTCAYKNNAAGLAKCNADVSSNPGAICGGNFDTCRCVAGATACGGGNFTYMLQGGTTETKVTDTGATYDPTGTQQERQADEWTRYLRQTDVSSAPGQQNVTTYTIDVFNAQQDANQTALLYSMATAGGGQYFAARNKSQIDAALGSIFAQINADNSAFASASLPVSATNRSLNVNEVYMGTFRPDADRRPLWYGNLKRYQIKNFNGDYKLADINGLDAVDTATTGFIIECATSWWTNDSGQFWKDIVVFPSAKGNCPPTNTPYDPFSDAPDGPKVEKGGVAEIIRQGNVGSGTPTWSLSRTLYTKNFAAFNTTNASSVASADVDFTRGLNMDATAAPTTPISYAFTGPGGTAQTTTIRPTVHGGVVHSRPLPVNYGGVIGTVLYYGADDGWYRAVNAVTGVERWAYMPEEFYSTLSRLRVNSPKIKYSFLDAIVESPAPTPKDYHFDGSTGLWQNADNSQVWIYPTMRRGGRMIYGFNVTNPSSPSLKWKKGCPNLADDTGCDPDYTAIGQTWSTPNVAKVNTDGASDIRPVLVVGGGYDKCEDLGPNDACAGGKGSIVYVIDANNGAKLASFTTVGRVASDVALIDIDFDGIADYGYVGTTRGKLYRLSFGPSKTAPLASGSWTLTLIGETETSGKRKFLNTPALVQGYDKSTNKTYVYVALGTGDREQPLVSQYPYQSDIKNRFYVFMDDVTSTETANLDDTDDMEDFTTDPGCGSNLVIPGGDKRGWFMPLPNRGEQTVTSAVSVGGFVAFSTNAPIDPTDNPNVCAPKGIARGYVVNLFNSSGSIAANNNTCGGDRSSQFVGGGLPPAPVVANVEVDGKVQTIVIGVADLAGRPSSPIQSEIGFSLKPQKRTRVYWRQEGDN